MNSPLDVMQCMQIKLFESTIMYIPSVKIKKYANTLSVWDINLNRQQDKDYTAATLTYVINILVITALTTF